MRTPACSGHPGGVLSESRGSFELRSERSGQLAELVWKWRQGRPPERTPAGRPGRGDVGGSASPGQGLAREGAIRAPLTRARQGGAPRGFAPAVLALLESARHGLLGASEEIN